MAKGEYDVDILARPRGRQGLVVLREAEKRGKQYLTAGEFETLVGLSTHLAKQLRLYYLHWDLVTVDEGAERGRLYVRIRLTPKGRTVADHFIEARKTVHGDASLRPSEGQRGDRTKS